MQADRALHHVLDQTLVDVDDIIDIHKGKLHVSLGKLGLPVRSEVLIAEASGNLEIAVVAGAHQELLEDLGRLGQRIECAGLHAAGNQIVARAFGRGFAENGRLDLEEALFVHKGAHILHDAAAKHELALHVRPAQVKAPVLKAELFFCIAVLYDVEGRCLGLGENPGIFHAHFNRSGGEVLVYCPAAQGNSTGSRHDKLRTHLLCLVEVLFAAVRFFIDQLDQAGAVPEVHKDDAALISLLGDPAHHCHCLSDIFFCQFSAPARPVQSFHRFCHSCYLLFLSVKKYSIDVSEADGSFTVPLPVMYLFVSEFSALRISGNGGSPGISQSAHPS